MPLPFRLRRDALLVALLFALLLVCACRSSPADSTRTVTDDLGRTVALPDTIERVVTLAPNLAEIVFAAGAGRKLVGVTTAADYPPAVDTLPRFSMLPTAFEAVAVLRPDLVLATDQVNATRDADTFAALDIPMYFFSFDSLGAIFGNIRKAGRLLGTPEVAQAAADSLARAVDRLRARTAEVERRPRVLFLISDETLYAFGGSSYVHTLIALAGGKSITADLDAQAPILSEEYVLTAQPEVIIGAFGADYDPERLLELHPTWDVVPAVENGRVYSIDPDLVNRPGPRVVEGARRMAQLLHPALFGSR